MSFTATAKSWSTASTTRPSSRSAAGLRISAQAPDGVIEAIETVDPNWFCIGVQWHPESETASALDMQLFEGFVQACIRAERSFVSVAA